MKFQEFRKVLNKPYFSLLDISLKNINIRKQQLSLWQKAGYVGRLKNGLYFFVEDQGRMTAEEVSFLLYEPSYLSLEFILSQHGLIPEIVYAKTAVTTKTTRKFSNVFGNFIYRHIQPKLFFGYEPMDLPNGKYLASDPEKAILDYLYFNLGKINGRKDLEELRINGNEFNRIINRKKIDAYLKEFNVKKLNNIVNILFEICSPSNS